MKYRLYLSKVKVNKGNIMKITIYGNETGKNENRENFKDLVL